MGQNGNIQSREELEFAIFCIESVATELDSVPADVYVALTEQSDILYRCIVPGYEVLHTQGKDYIVSDILDVMREEGILN